MGKPRLPWKRGPAAWKIRLNADDLKIRIGAEKRNFFSLRKTARLLNVSTQPLRDWLRWGDLKREGPRKQIARNEVLRLIAWFEGCAQPFDSQNYLDRLPPTWPFKKLGRIRFEWPKGRKALNPRELAALAGCHPSLVIKAIRSGRLRGRLRSPCRYEVTRHAWFDACL